MTPSATDLPLPPAPAAAQMDRLAGVVAPLARVTAPEVLGVDRIPDHGALFVGNHTIFGFLDLPFMMTEVWKRRGIALRGLGEHGHYAIPVWRDLLEMCGMVRGTRENVRALMHDGEHILVFPGGAGEVFKRRGQKYQLLWKERLGFARLAIEFGYPIVPFAAVGAEEMYDVIADDATLGYRHVSALMKRLVGVPLPPLPRGLGPTLLPRPERLYFQFGEPIDTTRFAGRAADDAAARELRDEVREAVEAGIAELQEHRERDPRRGLVARLRVPKQLEDPPGWPDAATWRGRDAVIARLEANGGPAGGKRRSRSAISGEPAIQPVAGVQPQIRPRGATGFPIVEP